MTNSQRLATIRNRLLSWIAESDDRRRQEPIIRETVLIRNEFYVGRRFYTDSHHAVWFIEEDELKIFGSDNQLLCVLSSAEIDSVETESPNMESAEPDQDESEPNVIKIPQPIGHQNDSDSEIRRAA
jgi:hypothetical protein